MLCNFPTEIINEILMYLSTVDLIEVIQANRRLLAIANLSKCPFRHQLMKRYLELSLNTGDIHDLGWTPCLECNVCIIYEIILENKLTNGWFQNYFMESVELSIVQKCVDGQNRRYFFCEIARICCNRWSRVKNLGLEPGYYISSSYELISMLNSSFDTTLGIHHNWFRLCN